MVGIRAEGGEVQADGPTAADAAPKVTGLDATAARVSIYDAFSQAPLPLPPSLALSVQVGTAAGFRTAAPHKPSLALSQTHPLCAAVLSESRRPRYGVARLLTIQDSKTEIVR